jgi:hypothetical protein
VFESDTQTDSRVVEATLLLTNRLCVETVRGSSSYSLVRTVRGVADAPAILAF